MRKKPCPSNKGEKRYAVRLFNSEWEEGPSLRGSCNAADAMIELALWLKSRIDDEDQNTIVLSVYHSYPYLSIEEEE